MPFKFSSDIRQKAKDSGTYLLGIHATSPYSHKGMDCQLEVNSFSKKEVSGIVELILKMSEDKNLIWKALLADEE